MPASGASGASGASWALALQQISVGCRHISAEEVADLASVLMLARRVQLYGAGRDRIAADLLGRHLSLLGYPVWMLSEPGLLRVSTDDTVVAFLGPDTVGNSAAQLGRAVATGAVILAIATPEAVDSLAVADAAVTLPVLASAVGDELSGMLFDLLAATVAEAIGQELIRRLEHRALGRRGMRRRVLIEEVSPARRSASGTWQ